MLISSYIVTTRPLEKMYLVNLEFQTPNVVPYPQPYRSQRSTTFLRTPQVMKLMQIMKIRPIQRR